MIAGINIQQKARFLERAFCCCASNNRLKVMWMIAGQHQSRLAFLIREATSPPTVAARLSARQGWGTRRI